MTYAGSRRIIDVDSHLFELDDFLAAVATPAERPLIRGMAEQKELPVSAEGMARGRALFAKRQADPEVMAKFEQSVFAIKPNPWSRLGAFDPEERSHTLDVFGFEQQWVLPTFSFHQVAHVEDRTALAAGARALNRAMGRFCAHDDRLRAIGYVPFSAGPTEALDILQEGLGAGCHTFMVDTNEPDPEALSFTHPDFDPVWDRFAEARVPFVAHVAVNGHYEAVPRSFHNNGRGEPTKVGDAPAGAIGFVTIKNSVELFFSAMIFDGVFDRHPGLRGVSMEHGAFWVPSWLQVIDMAAQALPHQPDTERRPSDIVRRHLRFAPFAGEPLGWITEQTGPDLLVFASDYPHPEGSDDPIRRFEKALGDCEPAVLEAFYAGNMESLLPPAEARSGGA